ncbi:alpha-galactosidase [Herbiconiux sp. L3-i23]|uniref:alpha-galactosidase n=1 Tax=Herbiconiux sp. L3-i23 TaxID=2905871 RepID=UPI00206196D0|nr:alpha-galactosidase [Herbiconiux sp. L3-i23]BDI24027.1 hypothetical protein L3i23_28030 [Herbiconiux sp. L3-i23]
MTLPTIDDGELRFGALPVVTVAPAPPIAAGVNVDRRAVALGTGGGVWEFCLTLTNTSSGPVEVGSGDAFSGVLADARWSSLHFRSRWGAEFEPVDGPLPSPLSLVGTAGRSSHGLHPFLALDRDGAALIVTVAWSGNWHIDVDGSRRIGAGLSAEHFSVTLAPGESVELPSVVVAVGADIDDAGRRLAAAVGEALLPRTEWSDSLPTEWNHWWPYEDTDIDEAIVVAEAEAAASVGLEVATLDAGWFGRPEASSDWQAERGDWAEVNTARFPSGLPALADRVREKGPEFGIWLEAEAVGASSRLRRERPELLALRSSPVPSFPNITVSLDPDDPTFLGYLCLGSPAAREFVSDALDSAVGSTGARWLKLDFNIDPGAGCDRTDHGHGAGDGLFRHYQGLYDTLDRFRERHPEVVLEACSSGGLRLDLGLARHVHCSFLSDPDWSEHHLQVLWGASLMLPPAAMLHWSWSEWRGDNPDQAVDFGPLSSERFDTMLRAAMLHRFGISMKLTQLPPHLLARVAEHVSLYRERLAPLIRTGVLRRLSAAPQRGGSGERVPVFQLDAGDRHLVAAFALDSNDEAPTLCWTGLGDDDSFIVEDLTGAIAPTTVTGAELAGGITVDRGASSWLLLASRVTPPA